MVEELGRTPRPTPKPKPRPGPRSCKRCVFWEPEWGGWGKCRRHAPTMVRDDDEGFWPMTVSTNWCGEFVEQPAHSEALDRQWDTPVPSIPDPPPPPEQTPEKSGKSG